MVAFVAAAIGWGYKKVSLIAVGLALWVLAQFIGILIKEASQSRGGFGQTRPERNRPSRLLLTGALPRIGCCLCYAGWLTVRGR